MKLFKSGLLVLAIMLFSPSATQAQTTTTSTTLTTKARKVETQGENLSPWYVGVKGGVPLGQSTFSSFTTGADRVSIGYNAGVLGGYNFNSIFSLEFSATFGQLGLNSTNYYGDNWLGSDGSSYLAPVAGEMGHYYRDIYSTTTLQQYGFQANISLIPAFDYLLGTTTKTRFDVMLSPAIYGVGTQSTLKTITNDEQFIKNSGFGFGFGGEVSVGYQITNNLKIALASGINQVIGSRLDGIAGGGAIASVAQGGSASNFIVNNSISISWRFGKKKRATPPVSAPTPVQYKSEEPKAVVQPKPIVKPAPVEKPEPIIEIKAPVDFPSVYFAFGKSHIEVKHIVDVDKISVLLTESPEIFVKITGSTDSVGSIEFNQILSVRRAQSLKDMLIKRGITESRIEILGAGIDSDAVTAKDARRAQVDLIIKVKQ